MRTVLARLKRLLLLVTAPAYVVAGCGTSSNRRCTSNSSRRRCRRRLNTIGRILWSSLAGRASTSRDGSIEHSERAAGPRERISGGYRAYGCLAFDSEALRADLIDLVGENGQMDQHLLTR